MYLIFSYEQKFCDSERLSSVVKLIVDKFCEFAMSIENPEFSSHYAISVVWKNPFLWSNLQHIIEYSKGSLFIHVFTISFLFRARFKNRSITQKMNIILLSSLLQNGTFGFLLTFVADDLLTFGSNMYLQQY